MVTVLEVVAEHNASSVVGKEALEETRLFEAVPVVG
jgi:hypothetical protein